MALFTVSIAKIIITLQSLSLLIIVWSLNHCTKKMTLNTVQGQRYIGSVYAVISNVRPQQCVLECISRKPRCRGVSYSRNRLSCEICSSTEHSITSEDYMTIDLEKVMCFPHQNLTEHCYIGSQVYELQWVLFFFRNKKICVQ
jgi:hypothetical protein